MVGATKMVMDGPTIVEKNIVSCNGWKITDDQIQPNGVDLRCHTIYKVTGSAHLKADGKMDYTHVKKEEALLYDGYQYLLEPHVQYLIDFAETVSVPDGYCGIIYLRSSLLRVGAFVNSAIWDTGFRGQLGASLRCLNEFSVEVGARMAQIVFYKAQFNGLRYDGRYQNATSQAAYIE